MFFFSPLKRKIESPRRRNSNFHPWVTRLPVEMNVHVVHIFWRLLQIPAFSLLPSKMTISNSSPLQGRRVNRLPSSWIYVVMIRKWYSMKHYISIISPWYSNVLESETFHLGWSFPIYGKKYQQCGKPPTSNVVNPVRNLPFSQLVP